ncbi:hypothetical protein OH77DRAFT_1416210 [Trametes cingulata]|nr:hypothetical protein OH77DRAFT_1416210 [Trametes cingulata]
MRVLSAFVTTTLFAGLAAALPAPESGAALLKRTDNYSGDASQSVSSSYASSTGSSGYSGSGYGSSSSSSSGYGSSSSNGYGSSSSSSSSSSSGYGSSSSSSSSDCKDGKCDSSSSKSDCSNGKCDSSSSKSDCSSGKCDSSNDSTSSAYMSSSTEYMGSSSTSEVMSTMTAMSTATSTASSSYATSTMSYGSGSTNWGNSGYNDCVQQCIASYGSPPSSWTPPTTTYGGDSSSGGSGSGTTHTVMVAPTQGVLRYVPFAINASVGDTVMFMWGANNHTVTKSSQLEFCNKTSDKPFTSGEQNKGFMFKQVVNDTNPTFYYCGTPGHCQKGMFGMINGPSNFNAPTSVSQMMGSMVSNSSDMAAMMAYTNKMTEGNDKAANWGANIDLAQMPEWSHPYIMENVMYTRAFLGANREVLKDDGSIDLNSHGAPLALPMDMAQVNNAVDSTSASAQPNAAPAASTAASASPAASSPAASGKSNGAASTAASSALLGVAAIAAAVLAL